jgi:hypothetical protein
MKGFLVFTDKGLTHVRSLWRGAYGGIVSIRGATSPQFCASSNPIVCLSVVVLITLPQKFSKM